MGNRKLSQRQRRRIAENQSKGVRTADSEGHVETSECNGRIISHFGQQLDVEILSGSDVGKVIRCHPVSYTHLTLPTNREV